MSFFAGIVALRPGEEIAPALRSELRKNLSREPGEKIIEHSSPSAFLAKVDLGVLGGAGWHADEAGRVSLLAGDPVLVRSGSAEAARRDDALAALHPAFGSEDLDVLTRCRG